MVMVKPNGAQMAEVWQLVEEGKLKPIVDRVLPLGQARYGW